VIPLLLMHSLNKFVCLIMLRSEIGKHLVTRLAL